MWLISTLCYQPILSSVCLFRRTGQVFVRLMASLSAVTLSLNGIRLSNGDLPPIAFTVCVVHQPSRVAAAAGQRLKVPRRWPQPIQSGAER